MFIAMLIIPLAATVFYHVFRAEGAIIFVCVALLSSLYAFRKTFMQMGSSFGAQLKSWDAQLAQAREDHQRQQHSSFHPIADRYHSLEELQCDLRDHGLESINMIVGVDFTLSNKENGMRTNRGRSLHDLSVTQGTPYQRVLKIICKTLKDYDEDGVIPAYMFGDATTTNKSVTPLAPGTNDARCQGAEGVSEAYMRRLTEGPCDMSGPTNFAPLIYKAIDIVKKEKSHHILIIVTDGAVVNRRETEQAIVDASRYPISIVAIGVGDADFGIMEEFDDKLPRRIFDNFQFVNWTAIISKAHNRDDRAEIPFAVAALQEIPDQIAAIKYNNLI